MARNDRPEKAEGMNRRNPRKEKRSDKGKAPGAEPVVVGDLNGWKPKTELGRKVKDKEITNIDEVLDHSMKILEPEVVDSLLKLEQELLLIGQSKGKFGGGAKRVFRQTQKKTKEGNKPKFATIAVLGDRNGHLGIGLGKAKETVPAREKSIRKAKLQMMKIRRGCGSWQCGCGSPHSIPFTITGKCGSIELKLMPAPKGKGLCCQKELAKILALAGIKDVWAKTRGQTRNSVNFIYACEDALRQLAKVKLKPELYSTLAVTDGSIAPPADQQADLSEIMPEKSDE